MTMTLHAMQAINDARAPVSSSDLTFTWATRVH